MWSCLKWIYLLLSRLTACSERFTVSFVRLLAYISMQAITWGNTVVKGDCSLRIYDGAPICLDSFITGQILPIRFTSAPLQCTVEPVKSHKTNEKWIGIEFPLKIAFVHNLLSCMNLCAVMNILVAIDLALCKLLVSYYTKLLMPSLAREPCHGFVLPWSVLPWFHK